MLPSWLPRQPWGQSSASPPAVPGRWRHCGVSKAPVTGRQMWDDAHTQTHACWAETPGALARQGGAEREVRHQGDFSFSL